MKKLSLLSLIFASLAYSVLFTACKKMPKVQVHELQFNSENVAYSQTSAEIKVDYEYPTNLQYVNVTMSQSNYFGYSIVAQAEVNDSTFIANFVDLQTDKNYYYKFEYSNGVNVMTSDVKSFYLDAAQVTLPTVYTMEIYDVTGTSAVCGGEIIDDGGFMVTARGVCWSTERNPTIFDNYTTDGMGTGYYESYMTGLQENTVYYVRAYAINEKGTSYGTEYNFETVTGGADDGVLPGWFSISQNQQVQFSKGNLQYQASTNTWRFADNQWEYIGSSNLDVSETYDGFIDLFAWGTSGYNHGATYYQPWSMVYYAVDADNSFYAYGSHTKNLGDNTGKADWGYNAISNGGNTEDSWRTLTKEEFVYLLKTRQTPSGIRYAMATVNGVKGVIILPDNWDNGFYSLNEPNQEVVHYDSNIIGDWEWYEVFERNGAVFMPAAGVLMTTYNYGPAQLSYIEPENESAYWTASYYNYGNTGAFNVAFVIDYDTNVLSFGPDYHRGRSVGQSVRLVHK